MAQQKELAVLVSPELQREPAVRVGLEALEDAARRTGWTVRVGGDVGGARTLEVRLSPGASLEPPSPGTVPTTEEQRYRIASHRERGRVMTTVTADGLLGAAYGIVWLADRLRACRPWPPKDGDYSPRFPQRFGHLYVSFAYQDQPPYVNVAESKKHIAQAIRQLDEALVMGATSVLHYDTQSLVPWDDPKLGPRSAVCRELYRELLDAAHARRMRIYPMGDEFVYLPHWFEKTGAKLSTGDPKFWEALKSKYRGLLKELPDIDGIATRIGEVIPRAELLAWDLIHTGEDRSLEGNYRRFVKAMHEVVVGEFDRQYFHRTWSVSTWEQASVPEVYVRTFTDEVPTDNLILCIKTTTGDQWEWQPLNPTFGLTPHRTAVTVETARAQDYLSGSPDFAVEFAQSGLEWALEKGAVATMINYRGRWHESLWGGMEYTAWRLAWDPYQPVREVVEDWARALVGPEIAARMVDLLLDLDDIHREGFHVHGVAYHTWEPFRHARKGWICRGNPFLDRGRGQHRHLRDLYLMAKPELESGLKTMADHTERYDRWLASYRGLMKELPDPERGRWLEAVLARGADNLHINLAYVTAFLRYFDYEDNADDDRRSRAARAVGELEQELPRFTGRLTQIVQGIEVFLTFARRGLDEPDALRAELAEAPDEAAVARVLDQARERDERLIESATNARLCARWQGIVDGRDVLRISLTERTWSLEPLLGDDAITHACSIEERPSGPGRFAVRIVLGGVRGWAHILEQPSESNGHVLSVLLDDRLPSYGSYDIEFHWIPGESG